MVTSIGLGVVAGIAIDIALTKGAARAQDDGEIQRKFENGQYDEAIQDLNRSEISILMDGIRQYIRDEKGQLGEKEEQELQQLEKELRKNDGL